MENLLFKKVKNLTSGEDASVNFVDVSSQVNKTYFSETESFENTILGTTNAVLNAYNMWLRSVQYDYIRSPSFGGKLGETIRIKFPLLKANETEVAAYVKAASEKEWPDISVLSCTAEAVLKDKEWKIELLIQDMTSKMVMNTSALYEGLNQ